MTYISSAQVGLALGPLGLTLGLWGFVLVLLAFALDPGGYLDTNILVAAKRKSRVGVITQQEDPTQRGLCCSGI